MLTMKNERLLVLPLKTEKKDQRGIIYTDAQSHRVFKGEIAFSSGKEDYPVGAIVYFSEFSGEEVWYEGKKYRIILEDDVFAIEEQDGKRKN